MLQKIVEIQKANARYDAEYDDYIVEEIQMEKVAKEIEALYKFRPLPAIAFPKYQIAREVWEEYEDNVPRDSWEKYHPQTRTTAVFDNSPTITWQDWLSQQEE